MVESNLSLPGPKDGAKGCVAFLRSALGLHRAVGFWCFDSTLPVERSSFPSHRFTDGVHGSRYIAAFTEGALTAWDGDYQQMEPISREAAILIDSDIGIAMQSILLHNRSMPELFAIIIDLAKKCAEWGAAIQPYSFMRQTLLTKTFAAKKSAVEDIAETVCRFQAFDTEATASSGSITYNSSIVEKMEQRYAASGFRGCAEQIVKKLQEQGEPPLFGDIVATYAFVLKLIRVGITHRKATDETRLAIMDAFLREELIQAQPRFFVLSRMFFSNKLGGLLKTSAGDPSFNIKKLIGGVWDIYQTTIHESVLSMSDPPIGMCSILCTRDRALADYAGHFPLRGVMIVDDGTVRLQHDWDDQWLKDILGEPLWRELVDAANSTDPLREQVAGDPERLCEIILELQDELGIADGSGLLSRSNPKSVVWTKRLPGAEA